MEKLLKHGGNIYELIEKYGFEKEKIIDFSSNVNVFFDFEKIKNMIISSIENIFFYPDSQYKKTREKIAEKFSVSYKNVILGNGSIELIYLIPKALKLKKSIIFIPTFSEYERSIKLNGGKILFLKTKEEDNFEIRIDEILKYKSFFDSIFLCNPNNPTGFYIEKEKIIEILKKNRDEIFLIDEAFIDFTEKESLVSEIKKYKNLLILRTFTKIFPIPGLRIGYLIGDKNLTKIISKYMYPWNINSLAENIAQKLIDFELKEIKKRIKEEKEYIYRNLKILQGVKVFNGEANFFLIKIERDINFKFFIEKLKLKGILVRDCSNIKGLGRNFIRICVRKRNENEKFLNELKCLLYQQ
ncbi:MAG: pyridoxal phosphate-dependent aminotransferase [Candidatus Ratteibacteria bacterium]